MSWQSYVLVLLSQVGITATAAAGVAWAIVTFVSKKSLDHYFNDKLERLKQELIGQNNIRLETHRAEQQRKLEMIRGDLAAALEDRKAGHQANLKKQEQFLNAEIALSTEAWKADLDLDSKTRLAISEKRSGPYGGLWSLMEPLSPRLRDNALDRAALEKAFREWYYASGNGLFLSWRAMKFYMQATDLLRGTVADVPDDAVRKAFSLLRTQMKLDIAVYTSDEAAAPVAVESQ